MALTSYTAKLTDEQVEVLRGSLEAGGFEFQEKPYAIYSAKRGKLNVTVYEKGPKVLVQGKETTDFVQFTLEPEVLGEARLGYEEHWLAEMFEPHFGVDESGKGDYFGPLVIAGVYTNAEITRALMDAGVMDSKRIGSAARIRRLAAMVRDKVGAGHKVIRWAPERYNELYREYQNVNKLLAEGHAAVIVDLHQRVPRCGRALSDQFTKRPLILSALKRRGLSIELQERTKAESDVAVAAASILARESFLDWMDAVSERLRITLPLGAGGDVKETATFFVQEHGRTTLSKVAKVHFKTTLDIPDEKA